MRTRFSSLYAWLYATFFTIVAWRLAPREELHEHGRRDDEDGIPVIFLSGSAYQRGFQHGVHAHAELHHLQQRAWEYARIAVHQRLGVPRWLARWITKPLLMIGAATYLPTTDKTVRAEVQGLSDASGINIRDLITFMNIWELLAMLPSSAGSSANEPIEHCSELALYRQDQRFFGYNYDVLAAEDRSIIEGYMALFIVRPSDGAAYITPNVVGWIGLNTAMNEHGVVFGWGNSYLRRGVPKGTAQTPYMLVLRELALSATTRAMAVERLCHEQRPEADITTILAPDGITVVELAGTQSATRTMPTTYSANRLIALESLDYLQAGRSPDGRHQQFPLLISQLPAVPTIDDVARILRDDTATWGRAIASDRTTFTVLYAPHEGIIWVSFHGSPASRQTLHAFTWAGERLRARDIRGVDQ